MEPRSQSLVKIRLLRSYTATYPWEPLTATSHRYRSRSLALCQRRQARVAISTATSPRTQTDYIIICIASHVLAAADAFFLSCCARSLQDADMHMQTAADTLLLAALQPASCTTSSPYPHRSASSRHLASFRSCCFRPPSPPCSLQQLRANSSDHSAARLREMQGSKDGILLHPTPIACSAGTSRL